MSLAEADIMRRSSAKFSGRRDLERLRGKFLLASEMMGLTPQQREDTWMMVEKFAGFGFCKAHAATYADISYRMAYLKTHHPAEFLAAMCSAGAGFYHVSAYVEEAKRWGIEVRLPSVNHSRMEYTAEKCTAEFIAEAKCTAAQYTTEMNRQTGMSFPLSSAEEAPAEKAPVDGRRALRIGLMQVRGLRVETITAIVRAREEGGAFRSLEDFLRRAPVEKDEIEALIKCGAFDEICSMTRPEMLWRWNLLQAKAGQTFLPVRTSSNKTQQEKTQNSGEIERRASSAGTALEKNSTERERRQAGMPVTLFPEATAEEKIVAAMEGMQMPAYTQEQKLRYEREILEVCVSGHPLDFLPRNGEVWSDELDGLRGKRVTLCGWVVTYRHVGTKNYRNMMFVTLEDQRGLYEVVLFPDAYDRYGGLVFETRAMRVTGRVEPGGQINGEKLEVLKK
jgi:DNA polymerase III alpha subunit